MFNEIKHALSGGLVCLVAVGGFSITSWAIWRESTASPKQAVVQQEAGEREEVQDIDSQQIQEQGERSFVLGYKTDKEIARIIFGRAEMTVQEARTLGVRGLEGRDAADTVRVRYPKVVMCSS